MEFKRVDPADYGKTITATFTVSELIGIYNAVLIDHTTNPDHILETEELLKKLAAILATKDYGHPAPPEA